MNRHWRSHQKNKLQKIKEDIFEKIRLNKFNNLPSRRTCMYLCLQNIDKVKYLNNFKLSGGRWFEIEIIKGITHISKFQYLDCNLGPISRIEDEAIKYWDFKFSNKEDPNILEVLFEGKFRVL
jgi:hypothetical protein